jgi:hypothetical protein
MVQNNFDWIISHWSVNIIGQYVQQKHVCKWKYVCRGWNQVS